ncbi:Hypothetical protein, putative [Bodo saltans]|uniref:Uncharacterized protein n=1 Tax=Bodo saltans TaxID=75058 RepID=A0A0S4JHP1_BODSA|nr:Hypothetical protein, putative [Bodo saltans]|eukprot:CUG89519.1 Hypothetical protein, putative [Bodo saltans]
MECVIPLIAPTTAKVIYLMATEGEQVHREASDDSPSQPALETAAPAKKARFSNNNAQSAAMQRYLAEEKAFRSSRRQWSKPSNCFKAINPREIPEHRSPSVDLAYNVKNDTIETISKKEARRASAAFLVKSPNRSPSPQHAASEGDKPHDVVASQYRTREPKKHIIGVANTVFRSTTPRLHVPPPLTIAQTQFNSTRPVKSPSRGAVAMISKSPRFHKDPVVLCDAVYDVDKKRTSKSPSTWAISKSPQRPIVNGTLKVADANAPVPMSSPRCITDINFALRKRSGAGSVFHSITPRFTTPREAAPPVGSYTSKYISHGMVA